MGHITLLDCMPANASFSEGRSKKCTQAIICSLSSGCFKNIVCVVDNVMTGNALRTYSEF